MREYGFSLTRILSYKDNIYDFVQSLHKICENTSFHWPVFSLIKDKIVDFVLIRENMSQWKPVFSHILCSDRSSQIPGILSHVNWRDVVDIFKWGFIKSTDYLPNDYRLTDTHRPTDPTITDPPIRLRLKDSKIWRHLFCRM